MEHGEITPTRQIGRLVLATVVAPLVVIGICAAARPSAQATSSQLSQTATTTTEPTAAISGVVVDAGSGRPIAGATVLLSAQLATRDSPPMTGVNTLVSDVGGRFVFTRLPAGDFTLQVQQFGYFDGGYGQSLLRNNLRRITLRDRQWFSGADIKLWRQSSISGVIVDETGEPVVGAWVRALGEILVAGQPRWASGPTTTTDDRGVYRIAGIAPGRWTVMLTSVQSAVPADTSVYVASGVSADYAPVAFVDGRTAAVRKEPALALDPRHRLILGATVTPPSATGRPQVYPNTFAPSARTVGDATVLDLSPGEDRAGVDITVRPVPAVKVSGTIEGDLANAAGMTVRLTAPGNEGLSRGQETATTIVAADGTFTLLGVPAGNYTLTVGRSVAGYAYRPAPLIINRDMPFPPGVVSSGNSSSAVSSATRGTMFETYTQASSAQNAATLSGRARVDVADRDIDGLVIRLTRGVTLSGRVVVEASDDPSRPAGLPFLSIWAEPANGDPTLGQPRSNGGSSTDGSAPFLLENLQSGEYLLRTVGGVIKSATFQGRDFANTPFDTSNGQDITGVLVTLTTKTAKISGTVRDAQGRPATTSTAVICFPAERDQWSRYGIQPPRLRSVSATNSGAFSFPSLPAGDYLVAAVDDDVADGWKDPKFLGRLAALADHITVAWGEAKVLDVKLVTIR